MDELDLKFDKMEVNTDLAKAYISAHNGEFYPIGCEPSEGFVLDNANNKLYYEDLKQKDRMCHEKPSQPIDSTVFEKLAQKIEENAELFSQLEVLIRKKRREEVIKWDIHLIVQNLLYHSGQDYKCYLESPKLLHMYTDSPLADLGQVASMLKTQRVIIEASASVGVVSHLFTKLCHEVGLTSVSLAYVPDVRRITDPPEDDSLGTGGCVGVVTANADTDSAVDSLLLSTTQYPWKVRRILIQESIYETVIKTLEWKCNLKPTGRTVDAKLKQSCTDAKFYEDKLLLFDYTGNYKDITKEDLNLNIVFVEAYRTSKELLSLVYLYEPLCLSLWCCDVAESDEIAFSVNTPIVWINEFGSFWGPTDASEAYYSNVYTDVYGINIDSEVEKLLKVKDAWRKIDIRSRKAIVKEALNSCADYKNNKEKVFKLISNQRGRDTEKFVEIQNNSICIGRKDWDEIFTPVIIDVEVIIGFLIAGGAVQLPWCEDDPFKGWSDELAKKGVPIMHYYRGDVATGGVKYNRTGRPNTKVVYKSFGTIYAN